MGVIDSREKVIVPLEYMEISNSQYNDGSYLARNKQGKYGFMRIDGTVTLPFEYDNLTKKYSNNIISIQDGKCGIVRVNSGIPTEIATCDYESISSPGEDYGMIVEKEGKFGLIDKYGAVIIDTKYESMEFIQDNSGFAYKTGFGGNYQLVDARGHTITSDYQKIEIIPNQDKKNGYYSSSLAFNYFKVQDLTTKKIGMIDRVGRVILEAIYDDIAMEAQGLLVIKQKGKFGMLNVFSKSLSVECQFDQIAYTDGSFYGFGLENTITQIKVQGDQIIQTKL